jgi:hypothetical protein
MKINAIIKSYRNKRRNTKLKRIKRNNNNNNTITTA